MKGTLSRREFLHRTTTIAASLAVPTFQAAPRGQSGMFISLPPWAVARNVGWPEQARLAARVGYAGIDWAFGPGAQGRRRRDPRAARRAEDPPTIVNLPMQDPLGGDEAAFKARLPQLEEDAAFAAAIGCRNFQLVLGATTPAGQRRKNAGTSCAAGSRRFRRVLAKHDMRLGLEFLGPLVFRTGRRRWRRRRGGPPAIRMRHRRRHQPRPCLSSGRSPKR